MSPILSLISTVTSVVILGAIGFCIVRNERLRVQKRKLAPSKDEVRKRLENLAKDTNDVWIVNINCHLTDDCTFEGCDLPDEITGNFEAAIIKLMKHIGIASDHYYEAAINLWNIDKDFIKAFEKAVLNDSCVSLRKKKVI